MNKQNFIIKNSIPNKYLKQKILKKFANKIKPILEKIKKEIDLPDKTLHVLSKKFNFNFNFKDLKNFNKYQTIALVGMGGSILGTEALYDSLKSKIKKKVYFFNNLDEDQISNFKKKENFSKILFIVISKSGNTVETLSNALSLNILKKNSKNVIIISEKKNNSLFLITKKLNLYYIEHKSYIGGRYSVLSEVGVVPAYLMGLNVNKLRSHNNGFLKKGASSLLKADTIKIASLINSNKFNSLIFLNYSPEIEKFLYWAQQLIAESLGKKGKGFLPVISNVPKDHHSLLQLYLDGPKDKFFYIFSCEKKSNVKINLNKSSHINKYLNKKDLSKIKSAQRKALIKAFIEKKIPFREFKIKTINEKVLGKLFALFIVETIIVGNLLRVNPFDQPAVERVKDYTKQFLS